MAAEFITVCLKVYLSIAARNLGFLFSFLRTKLLELLVLAKVEIDE